MIYRERLNQDEFTAQKREAVKVQGTGAKDDDFTKETVSTSTYDQSTFFTTSISF